MQLKIEAAKIKEFFTEAFTNPIPGFLNQKLIQGKIFQQMCEEPYGYVGH